MNKRAFSRIHFALFVTLLLPCAYAQQQPLVGSQVALLKPRPPKHPKLSTPLADLVGAVPQQRGPIPKGQRIAAPPGFSVEALPKSVRDLVRAGKMRINKDAEVQVYIQVAEVTDENLQQFQAAGVTVELSDKQQRIVQGRVPVTRLEEVAALPFVKFVRLPDYGLLGTGSVDTQGDTVLKTDQVRSLLGVNGSGVRVGVISGGIAGIFATGCTTCGGVSGGPISTGDLPNATGTRNASGVLTSVSGGIIAQSFRTDGDLEMHNASPNAEGTAMVEIVHDLAPGAQLLFANFDTSLEFNQAVNFLSANADVVVDDIQFVALPPLILGAMPYDGTSAVSTNTAGAFNSNGNPVRARFVIPSNFARQHYREDFFDSGVDGAPIVGFPGNLHLFQPTADTSDVLGLGRTVTDVIDLPAGATVVVSLIWNDPLGASNNDYDLFLLRKGIFGCLNFPDVVARSIDPQNGTQDPVEKIGYTNSTGADDDFCIVIQNSQNTAGVRNFDMFVLSAPPLPLVPTEENHNYNTIRSSITAPGDAGGSPVSVITVGAANWATPDSIEVFSGNGPTTDGRLKPDVIAVDGVSITGAGGFSNPFSGTSAAAPHGAGVAALLLQSSPCLLTGSAGARTPVDGRTILRNLLTSTAVDLGIPGSDNVFGFGRLEALAAANRTIPSANAGPNQAVNGTSASGASITLNGTASSDPNACPLTFNWTGACGTATGANPTLICPLGINTMNLTVTNNGVTLSAPSNVQIAVTDFTASTSPNSVTVRAGQAATYTVSIAPQFGPFSNAVSLTCSNLPALSSCTFSPSTVTPGGSTATSTLTIPTTAPSAFLIPPLGQKDGTPLYAFFLASPALTLFGMGLVGGKLRKGRLGFYLSLVLLAGFLVLHAACGGGGGGQPAPRPGTPTGTFTITITGASGSLQRSTTGTLVVQ